MFVFKEYQINFPDDRHFNFAFIGKRMGGPGRVDAFSNHFHSVKNIIKALAPAEFKADCVVATLGAGAGQQQLSRNRAT